MLKTVDIVIIVVYFSVMFILGIVAWKRNKTSEDYFVAGKSLGTFSLASMWLSSWIGGASIVGTATDAYNLGVSGGWYVTILALGTLIFGLTFTQLVKRLGDKLHDITYPALITSRYDKKAGTVVVVSCFLANVGFLSSQLVAMGSMLTTITGWDPWTSFLVSTVITIIYSAIGGLLAITYTTWIQFVLIILGTVVLGIPLAARAMGGLGEIATLPSEWFDIGRYGWPTIIALGVSSIFSFFTSMDSYTRSFAAKNSKVARRGTIWAAVGVLCIAVGATYMGMAAKVLMPDMADGSSAYAAIVVNYFPTGISGLVLVGVFAAIMSTGVVCINSCAANVSVDIYRDRINPKASDKNVSLMGIASSLAVGIVGAALAWWKYDIVDLLLLALTFQAASLFFPTVFGMFWKRATKKAAFASMCVSLAVVFIWLLGDGMHWGKIFEIDALWPGLLASGIVFFAVALLVKPTEDDIQKAELFCSVRTETDAAE